MYNIKETINRLKKILNIDSNIELAKKLNISYNTLNTWIKRSKLPQEVLIELANQYNISLDYLLFGKNSNTEISLFDITKTNKHPTFKYYGVNQKLNIEKYAILTLDKKNLHSGSYCLLNIANLYTIAQIELNIFSKTVDIIKENSYNTLSLEDFNNINLGMIINVDNFSTVNN